MALQPTVWSNIDKAASISVVANNLRAQWSSTATGNIRSSNGATAGKWFWEVTNVSASGSYYGIGVGNNSASLSTSCLVDANCCVVRNADGHIFLAGVDTGIVLASISASITISIAVDLDAKLIWFRHSTQALWNNSGTANPATGVGGINIASIVSGTVSALVGNAGSSNGTMEGNFGATAFVATVPSGYTAGLGLQIAFTPTTWSGTDKHSTITVSGSTATAGTSNGVGIRSIFSATSGKYYWEVVPTSPATNMGFGVATSTATLASGIQIAAGSAGLAFDGSIYVNGALSVSAGITVATRIEVALDLTNRRLWIRSATTRNWNGNASADPATNVGGVDISSLFASTSAFAFATLPNAASQNANFGAVGFASPVPSGFQAGLGGPTLAQVTQAALEQWFMPNANAQSTQAALELWGSVGATANRAIATQVALEQWGAVAAAIVPTTQARVWVMA